jgi:hypothetical protein
MFLLLSIDTRAQLAIKPFRNSPVYVGVRNAFQVKMNGYNIDDILLKSNIGIIKRAEDSISEKDWWTFEVCKPGQLVVIAIHKKTNKILDSVSFNVRYTVDPVLFWVLKPKIPEFEVRRPPFIDIQAILAVDTLSHYHPCSVTKFTMELIKPNGKYFEFENIGGLISDKGREFLRTFNNGDTIMIKKAAVKCGCEEITRTPKFRQAVYKNHDEIFYKK